MSFDLFRLMARASLFGSILFSIGCLSTVSSTTAAPMPSCKPLSAEGVAAVVPLTTEFFDTREIHYISGGIPFSFGQVKELAALKLFDQSCAPARFQIEPLAQWPDLSIKSALLTLPNPQDGKQSDRNKPKGYYLVIPTSDKTANKVSNSGEAKPAIHVETTHNEVVISDDQFTYRIPTNKFSLFSGVRRKGGSRSLISGGDLYMVKATDKPDGESNPDLEYLASQASRPSIAVEHQGPMKVVVKSEGQFVNRRKEPLIDYLVRYTFYANASYVDIDYSVVDRRTEENVREKRKVLALSVSDYGLRMNSGIKPKQFYFGGEEGTDAVHQGKVTDRHEIVQHGRMNYRDGQTGYDGKRLYETVFKSGREILGKRAQGWMAVAGADDSISVMVKGFWQQYPNRLTVDRETIEVSLHPKEARNGAAPDLQLVKQVANTPYRRPNTFYFAREGGAKTYQMRIGFSEGQVATGDIQQQNNGFQQHKLRVRAPFEWYANSRVFGEISVSDKNSSHYDNNLYEQIYKRSTEQAQLIHLYGWRDYGDRMRPGWSSIENGVRLPGFYNDTHVGSNIYFIHYLRTGRPDWFSFAERSTRHFMDIDVAHGKRKGVWKKEGRKIFAPPGEIHAIKHSQIDHQTRNLHQGHAHVSGLSNYYLLTGDRRSLDVLKMIGNWWRAMTPVLFPLPRPDNIFSEAERDFGWPLYCINEVVWATNDVALHRETAAHLTQFMIDWWKEGGPHIINGETLGYHDYTKGTGWWRMVDMDNGKGTGTNPWMAGSLVTNLIRFYQADQMIGSDIDRDELKEMLYQTMNYIVRTTWRPDPSADKMSGIGHFAYSEARKKGKGGKQHLVYPLAYLYKMLQEDMKAGKVKNIDWYETYPLWKAISMRYYQDIREKREPTSSSKFGFYGYEIIFPEDYFTIMKEIEHL